MRRPDISKLLAALGGISSLIFIYHYYKNIDQPNLADLEKKFQTHFDEVRTVLN